MNNRKDPILIWLLHLRDEEVRQLPTVTRTDIMDGSSLEPHPDGLFSTRIFGEFGTELRDELFGKIDLKVHILHPKIYRDLMSLRKLYREIINGSRYAYFDRKLGDFVPTDLSDERAETGYSFFIKYLKELKFKRNESSTRTEKIKVIEKYRDRILVKNWPVLPAGLRDIEISGDGRITKDEINDFYYKILATTLAIIESDDMDAPEYDGVRRILQNSVNGLYEYIEGLSGGKDGFLNDKFLSRRVMDGTRNVITAMDAAGKDLNSPNVPNFDSTVVGLYQASRGLAPKYIYWLSQGPLSKLVSFTESSFELVNKKTLKREWVEVSSEIIDEWVSELGLMNTIHKQKDIAARNRPIEIGDSYLALVAYNEEEGWFKVFNCITEIPDNLKGGKTDIHPITLCELIYYAGYDKINKHYLLGTRYPVASEDSIYPNRYYVKTTTTSMSLYELTDDWELIKDDDRMATEWPIKEIGNYHDGHSLRGSVLSALGADSSL